MLYNLKRLPLPLFVCVVVLIGAQGQTALDLTKQPTLYGVAYAHLDTEWRWEYSTTIRDYITKTMYLNFNLIEKYPHYIFNFSGANRYRMMKEYYPADYERVKKYVSAGRWYPAGSSMEENDVNSPSAESIIRQILYGTQYFRSEFGKTSAEFMLPDCFGFPYSLPSILAHCGIKGFSTQKLTWASSALVGGQNSLERTPNGIPFNVGIWEGPDGKSVIAALNPGGYGSSIGSDLSKSPAAADSALRGRGGADWAQRIQRNGEVSGVFADYMYYGTGDTGGSPSEASVWWMEGIVTKSTIDLSQQPRGGGRGGVQLTLGPVMPQLVKVGDGPVTVISARSDQMFLDIKPEWTTRMPRYKGELELTNHSAGSLTSQSYMKRWNRMNEVLADNAERASVTAQWLGGRTYPLKRLNDAWTLVMGGQFHDIIPGTSTPKAYEFAWNDQVLAMNQFASVLTSATEAVASGLNTQTKGTAIVVYNALNIEREDVVEAAVSFPTGVPKAVRVFGPDGIEVPAQLTSSDKVLFLAKVPSVGYAVYDVQAAEASTIVSTLKITESSLENARYRIQIDRNGDVASIFDKILNKELLLESARLEIKTDNPTQWPAWNMDWADQSRPPRDYVSPLTRTGGTGGGRGAVPVPESVKKPLVVRIVENGPVRIALEIERADSSRFVQTIRLSAGDAGNRIEFFNVIDWKTYSAHLKAVFPLTAANPVATYNLDIGTIQRSTNEPRKFEVMAHQWFDLTDISGSYGVTVLSDCKNASDKPSENTLRLTLIRTPGTRGGYPDQGTQDLGHHEFIYGLASHAGDWRQGQTDWQAYRLNQPLIAFEASKHQGALGKNFSLMKVSSSRVRVLALKKAEQSDEVVVRLVEVDGKAIRNVSVSFAAQITAAREVNGQEMPVGNATVTNGKLVTDFTPYQPRTFAVKLDQATSKVGAPRSQSVTLSYNLSTASQDSTKSVGGFDASGRALPAEMLPSQVPFAGIVFNLAPAQTGKPNAVVTRGQTISLPVGNFTRVYILAASAEGDQKATFQIGDKPVELTINDWGGYIGQWDNRVWKRVEIPPTPEELARQASQDSTRRAQLEATLSTLAASDTARRNQILQQLQQPRQQPRLRTQDVLDSLTPGFIKSAPVAWFASHRHTAEGVNEPYAYSYLFAYVIDMPANAKTLTLPNNDKIRILAVTVANESAQVRSVQSLYDSSIKIQK